MSIGFVSNAELTDKECDFESITMNNGSSIRFCVENDPEYRMSGMLEPEDWSWIE